MIANTNGRGAELAERLGIPSKGRDGHNVKAACIACDSSDAFRIHAETGVAFCHSCQAKYSRLELATKQLGNEADAWKLLEQLGLEQPRTNGHHHHNGNGSTGPTLLERVAKLKGATVEALEVYGAKMEGGKISFPQYGRDGKQCSTCKLGADGGKGMNEKDKPSGVFLPHNADGTPRLPQPGETWHIVEGVKDAAALFALGLLACGLPGSAMQAKFARLFAVCNVILIPDRDKAGVEGVEKSAARLYGAAASVRIVTLPAEFKDSKGADVRDVLKQPGGRELVLQAIAEAKPWAPQVVNAADEPEGSLWTPHGRTDIANGRRLTAKHAENIRWCDLWNCWEHFSGKRWTRDGDCKLHALAKLTADGVWQEIASMLAKADRETATALIAFGRRTASANGLRDLLTVARSEPGIPIMPDAFDRDPLLFNVENGTIDLRTGELRPHRRADMLTKLAPVEYNADADCPLWRGFLKRVMDGNGRLIDFLRRFTGYSLTGLAREHALAFLYGSGANGKSTFLNTLLALFGGDYAMKAAPELLMAKRGESHPCDRADLFGRRLVCCIETEDGRRMAEALVKEMTGGDKIRARFMRENFFEFPPTHTIWLAANHRPIIKGTDCGIWRRIKLIPFTVEIPKAEQDGALPEKLLGELPGILNWAIAGCIEWQADGLAEPPEVSAATNEYRDSMDVLGQFLDECCTIEPTATTKASDVRKAYEQWCEQSGEHPINGRRFGDGLTERGITRRRSTGLWYDGIALN